MQRTDSLEKTLVLGRLRVVGEQGNNRGWDGWMALLTQWSWVWVSPGVGDRQGGLGCCSPWGRKESDTADRLNWAELMGPDAMILVFWMLGFKAAFSLSSFTLIKSLFISSLLSAIRMVPSAYLRLLIFLPAILIPACASSIPAFHVMFSAYKLNKQGDNIQPQCTPFPISNQSVVPCPVLTVASWPAYNFLRRQVRWSGIPISFRIFYSLLWSTQSKALA